MLAMTRHRLHRLGLVASAIFAVVGVVGCSGDQSHAAKEHAPPKYDAAFHDEDGKHQHQVFDLANAEHKAKLEELISHGHVVEMKEASPPGLDKIFSFKADLGIWSLVVFFLLFLVLSRMAWPKMLSGLQRRESNIRGALEEAQKARDEAAGLRAQFQKEMDGAQEKVKGIMDDARRVAQENADEMIAKAKTEIGAERERAHREITVETDQALQTIWTKAADLATQISAAALGKQLDVNMHRRLVDEALNDLKTASRN
jgi:F-type H+-transporting ATPase subunit b